MKSYKVLGESCINTLYILYEYNVLISSHSCQIFEANKGLEIMTIFTIFTLKCLTSNSLCEPKVSFFRKYWSVSRSL